MSRPRVVNMTAHSLAELLDRSGFYLSINSPLNISNTGWYGCLARNLELSVNAVIP